MLMQEEEANMFVLFCFSPFFFSSFLLVFFSLVSLTYSLFVRITQKKGPKSKEQQYLEQISNLQFQIFYGSSKKVCILSLSAFFDLSS
jgi:hypothetical protein